MRICRAASQEQVEFACPMHGSVAYKYPEVGKILVNIWVVAEIDFEK